MAYNKTNWVDGQNIYDIKTQADAVIESDIKLVYKGTGGTALSSTNLNKIEDELELLDIEVMQNLSQQPVSLTNSSPTQSFTVKQACGLDVTVNGSMTVNLLGRDGDCEDLSKWLNLNTTLTLDSTNKVFGENAFKGVLTHSIGYLVYRSKANIGLNNSKNYLISSYLKNGNTSNGIKIFIEGSSKSSSIVTDASKFNKVGIKLSSSEVTAFNDANNIAIRYEGSVDEYAFVDGIQINEITETEYNTLTIDQLLTKYPYVNSAKPLMNPTIEIEDDTTGVTGKKIYPTILSKIGTYQDVLTDKNGVSKVLRKVKKVTGVTAGATINYSDMVTSGLFVAIDETTSVIQQGVKGATLTLTNTATVYYQLTTAVSETIQPIILGDGLNVVEGSNTVTLSSGEVWEKAKPVIYIDASSYYINVVNSHPSIIGSELKYKAKVGYKIFKNGVDDTSNWIKETDAFSNGGEHAYILGSNFDTQADYYVHYEVLHEEYDSQVADVTVYYKDNLRSSTNEAVENIANLQKNVSDLNIEIDEAKNPVGTIIAMATVTVPSGYLECNGASLNRGTYSRLFEIIGTTFGSVDASTFNLPDLRGEFLRGFDNGRGVDTGRVLGSFQEATSILDKASFGADLKFKNSDGTDGVESNQTGGATGVTPEAIYRKVRPRNIALKFCIKY